MTSNWNLY